MNNVTVKEIFRKFASEHGFADEIVIDNDMYSDLSEITGCFQSENGKWVVYDTDERGTPYNIEQYTSQKKAYKEVAERFGIEEYDEELFCETVNFLIGQTMELVRK